MNDVMRKESAYPLHAVSEKLGVSLATVNNWIKTKVIPPPDVQKLYSEAVFNRIIKQIKNDQKRLNSRANRSLQGKKTLYYCGISSKERKLLLQKLVNDFGNSGLSIAGGVLGVSLALLRSNKLINDNWKPNANSPLDKLLSQWYDKSDDKKIIKDFSLNYEIPNYNDDILGAFYQSIQSVSQKSAFGSFYTPPELLKDIKIPANKTVLDPCCGSGNILLNIITKKNDPSKIYARDIDETALKICHINLALFFNDVNIAPNISMQDITRNNKNNDQFNHDQFDFIVTNPPWGSKFTIKQKESLCKFYPELSTPEIFSIALYNARKMLGKNGELYFFLPYSFLNVAAHRNIRRFIFNDSSSISVKLLGNAFKGVLSESILLNLKNSLNVQSNKNKKEISVYDKDENIHKIQLANIMPPDYIVSAAGKTQDILLIDKIYKTRHTALSDNTIFALGIVTGNNKKYLIKEKSTASEPVYRGKDIDKYVLLKPAYNIVFKSELFQQVSNEEYYRQRKIVYRFIGDRLVFALDEKKSLILNSANLLISKNYPMETVVSFFNSDIYTFIFRKKFNSKKILKSHLQDLPLPVLTEEKHQYIKKLYNENISSKKINAESYQNEIDKIICGAFSINNEEYQYIRECISLPR